MLRVLFTIKIIVVCLCFTFSANGRGEAAEIIVVTAAQLGLPKSAIGSTVTVITAEDIQKRGLIYAGDILREVPGVAISRSGTWGTLTNIRVRGAEANHTQVLIDGIEVNDPATDSAFNLGSLTLDNMERIEIIRGPQSALSGSDAIGAVVNFITRKGRGAGSLSGSVEVGGRDTLKAAIGGNFANDYFNYNINAEVLGTDGFNIARGAGEDDGHDNRSYDLKLGVTPFETLHLELVARHVDSDTDTDPQPSSRVVDGAGNGTLVDQTYWSTRMQWSLFDYRWRHRLQVDTTETRNGFRSAFPSSTRGRREKYAYQTGFSFATPALSHNPSFLFEYQDDSATGTFVGGGSEIGFISKSYAGEYHLGVFDRLFITAGARFDDNEFFDGAETYRITGAYNHKDDNMRFHTSYGTGVKNPTISELFGNFPNFMGNPDLKPESVKGWDWGIEQTWMDQRVLVDVTYFHNTITDQIIGRNNTVANSPGSNRIDGIEMVAKVDVKPNLSVSGTYTYTRAKDADGRESIRRARHIASLNLNYAFIDKRANINLGVHHNGEQQDTVFSCSPTSCTQEGVTLDGFTLVNLNASYRINDALTTYLRVENLLDEGYEEVYSYRAPGINGFLGLKLNFNR